MALSDEDFKRLVAILRLSVPYTGMILTAREPAELRREVMALGVSQIDAGSRIELGGYTEAGDAQVMEREQFQLGDVRSLDEVTRELMVDGYVPSFCTACYRLGRTGEYFMEFAIPGFIQNMCTPNALTTLLEYLIDYASPETLAEGEAMIQRELAKMSDGPRKTRNHDLQERFATSVANPWLVVVDPKTETRQAESGFQNEEAMSTFLADPVPFTPVLNEIDVVRFFEERTIVPGKREWGVKDPTFQRMLISNKECNSWEKLVKAKKWFLPSMRSKAMR